MNKSHVSLTRQRSWALAFSLLSLVVPLAAMAVVREQQMIGALAIGLVCAVSAFLGARALTPTWLRTLLGVVATLGALLSAYLLVTLIGTCGVQVIWGICQP